MNSLDIDPKGYLPLLRLLAARFWHSPKVHRANRACCA